MLPKTVKDYENTYPMRLIFDPYFTTKKTGDGLGPATAYSKNITTSLQPSLRKASGPHFLYTFPLSDIKFSTRQRLLKPHYLHPKTKMKTQYNFSPCLLLFVNILLKNNDIMTR